MKQTLIYVTILIAFLITGCNEDKKAEEVPKVKTNYVMPAEMIEDKNGNQRFEQNYLAPKSERDKPVKVYPIPEKKEGVEVIKVN